MAQNPIATPEWDELVSMAQTGDACAFGEIVERVSPSLLTLTWRMLGNREDAWDAVQDGLFDAWKGIRGYRGEAGFYAWLRAIVVRAAIRTGRQRSRAACRPLEMAESIPLSGNVVDPAERALASLDREKIIRALAGLPLHYRTVFWLREGEDMPYDEIAGTLGIPIGTVRSRLAKSRELLKVILGGMVS